MTKTDDQSRIVGSTLSLLGMLDFLLQELGKYELVAVDTMLAFATLRQQIENDMQRANQGVAEEAERLAANNITLPQKAADDHYNLLD